MTNQVNEALKKGCIHNAVCFAYISGEVDCLVCEHYLPNEKMQKDVSEFTLNIINTIREMYKRNRKKNKA